MSPLHIALAVLVAMIWGGNFVAIKLGLAVMPPLTFTALRFMLAAAPFLLFYRSPGTAWKWVIGIGLALGVGQFGLLFSAINMGMPAGLSSAVLQTQAFFTSIFAIMALGERPGWRQWAGMAVAFIGVLTIAGSLEFGALGPFLMVIGAAACWAASNILTRKAMARDAVRLMVWVSMVPPLPLLAMAYWLEGPERMVGAITGMTWMAFGSLAYIAFGSTIIGYGFWSFLLKRYPAAVVAPFSLLVPLFGLSSAALLLGERPGPQKLAGAALIILGVAVNSWPNRRKA
jgi:O-acetylserine/cysteine efflux transporter